MQMQVKHKSITEPNMLLGLHKQMQSTKASAAVAHHSLNQMPVLPLCSPRLKP
jgi:hypothetical protein